MTRNTLRVRAVGLVVVAASVIGSAACGRSEPVVNHERVLVDGWRLRAAAEVSADGTVVSRAGFDTSGWVPATVPSTPMGALVDAGEYPDLYVGTNLTEVDTGRFAGPWWYRTEFEASAAEAAASARLILAGVNGSAEVWLNGERLAGPDRVVGAFRVHELDVGGRLTRGTNTLAIAVGPPRPDGLTLGNVARKPPPPDANMGLWRPVRLRLSGAISLADVDVQTEVERGDPDRAEIRVAVRVRNNGDDAAKTTVGGRIGEVAFTTEVNLEPNESRLLQFTPDDHPQLALTSPRLWWPHTMGSPELYELTLEATVDGSISDRTATTFGIRSLGAALSDEGQRGFTVNGVPVPIRGGGWVDDLLLSDSPEKIDAQIAYVVHMGLNTIRVEGFRGSSHHLLDAADRAGVMVMPTWSCQRGRRGDLGTPVDETPGGVLEPDEPDFVAASLADQIRSLRNHPSILTWVLASDPPPDPELERRYLDVLAETDPTRPPLVSHGRFTSEASGPGPFPPPLESLLKMIPPDHLWPVDEVWDFHCGSDEPGTMERSVEALDRRYGPSGSVEDFAFKAQAASYEAIRTTFESFAAMRPLTTGLVRWTLDSAWPETCRQLFDWYLMPNGAFYGTRTACRPLSLVWDYASRAVVAVNDTPAAATGLTGSVRAFDLAAREIFADEVAVDLEPHRARTVVPLAGLEPATSVWFLDLRLSGADGAELAHNFYWLPTARDVLDDADGTGVVTPASRHADFTALDELDEVALQVSAGVADSPDGPVVEVELHNPGDGLAFFTELRVLDADGSSILPVLWNDNYVSLLPGERRRLTARLPGASTGAVTTLAVRGWNSAAREIPLR